MYYICTDIDVTQITEPLYITGSSKNPDGELGGEQLNPISLGFWQICKRD